MRRINRRELREWMGMTRADMCVYCAFAGLAAMFLVRSAVVDLVLALLAVSLALASCRLGMKWDPEFEDITNLIKSVSYPAAMFFVMLVILMHYVFILNGHADYAGYGIAAAVDSVNRFFRQPPGNL